MSDRFVVTTREGFYTTGGTRPNQSSRPGISYHVLDTLWNHRLMGSFRSESYDRSRREAARARARDEAQALCDRLNEAS